LIVSFSQYSNLTFQLQGWADPYIYFRPTLVRKAASVRNWQQQFQQVDILLDGKHFPLRQFSKESAKTLYYREMFHKDYHSFKFKRPGMLIQVLMSSVAGFESLRFLEKTFWYDQL
jgi:hypothetical protein